MLLLFPQAAVTNLHEATGHSDDGVRTTIATTVAGVPWYESRLNDLFQTMPNLVMYGHDLTTHMEWVKGLGSELKMTEPDIAKTLLDIIKFVGAHRDELRRGAFDFLDEHTPTLVEKYWADVSEALRSGAENAPDLLTFSQELISEARLSFPMDNGIHDAETSLGRALHKAAAVQRDSVLLTKCRGLLRFEDRTSEEARKAMTACRHNAETFTSREFRSNSDTGLCLIETSTALTKAWVEDDLNCMIQKEVADMVIELERLVSRDPDGGEVDIAVLMQRSSAMSLQLEMFDECCAASEMPATKNDCIIASKKVEASLTRLQKSLERYTTPQVSDEVQNIIIKRARDAGTKAIVTMSSYNAEVRNQKRTCLTDLLNDLEGIAGGAPAGALWTDGLATKGLAFSDMLAHAERNILNIDPSVIVTKGEMVLKD